MTSPFFLRGHLQANLGWQLGPYDSLYIHDIVKFNVKNSPLPKMRYNDGIICRRGWGLYNYKYYSGMVGKISAKIDVA